MDIGRELRTNATCGDTPRHSVSVDGRYLDKIRDRVIAGPTLCRFCYNEVMEPPVQDLALSPKMAAIIKIFLEDTEKPRYGLELMRLTGQPSGTLYPALAKFERAGWLVSGKEDVDPSKAGRPARRFYRISGAGARAAHC